MVLILDEWVIHDLQNENGEERRKECIQFLEKIKKKCDKIAFIQNSKFVEKIWNFAKSALSIESKSIINFLTNIFISNSLKCERINIQDVKIEDTLSQKVNPDDHYLLQAYNKLTREGYKCVIITTDKRLKKAVQDSINIHLRDDFIKEYLNE